MGDFRHGGHRRHSGGQRDDHEATCAACGEKCTVPFKPTPGRDVFCQKCFRNRRH